jgi:hypothetical protein
MIKPNLNTSSIRFLYKVEFFTESVEGGIVFDWTYTFVLIKELVKRP